MREVEEYELLPVSPLNKIQKQISKLQDIGNVGAISEAIDRLIESNVTLQLKISKLLAKMDKVFGNLNELLEMFKSVGEEEEAPSGDIKSLSEKVRSLTDQNKELMEKIEALSQGKMPAPKVPEKIETPKSEPATFEYKRKLL